MIYNNFEGGMVMNKMDVNPEIKKQIFTMYKNIKYLREKKWTDDKTIIRNNGNH